MELQIKQVEANLHQAMAAQTRWLLGGLAILGTVFKLADLLIGPLSAWQVPRKTQDPVAVPRPSPREVKQ